jgi:hypothetical protein
MLVESIQAFFASGLLGLVAQLPLTLLKELLVLGAGELHRKGEDENEADAAGEHWTSSEHHSSSDGADP